MRKRDYSRSIAPNFDAVEDIKDWLGERGWRDLQKKLKYASVLDFISICGQHEIVGFPIQALYDMIHGEGKFKFDVMSDDLEKAIAGIRAAAEKGARS